ncbi:hypothetical protein JW897_08325 [Chromobacterium alkanivorans]|uniref:hypothetical protein n=1 Tax=Chromobacterium alkanivorans TaxID=1071719 RepID=UPI001967379C|nr:hypothetical protein [Chromobacterium alkanivorans]MBN3003737.1 hypothetical protein [Chromobacterium alkanivorans]
MQNTSPADQITASLQLLKTIQKYLDMQSWTPVMGAMLLAGVHPPCDCEAIPTTGGTSLDGNPIIGSGNTPFYEAGIILRQWNDWCADEGSSPSHVVPLDFINWCIEDEIQERYAVSSSFIWISIFKNSLGSINAPVPFEIAEYASQAKEPLDVIIKKLDLIDRKINKQQHASANALVSISSDSDVGKLKINPYRQHLTTEEFANGLNVMPQTILKAYSINENYCGVRPIKLSNRRLAWPLNAVELALRKNNG